MRLIGSVDLCFAELDESGDRGRIPDDVPSGEGVAALPCEMRDGKGNGPIRGFLLAVPTKGSDPYLSALAREGLRALRAGVDAPPP